MITNWETNWNGKLPLCVPGEAGDWRLCRSSFCYIRQMLPEPWTCASPVLGRGDTHKWKRQSLILRSSVCNGMYLNVCMAESLLMVFWKATSFIVILDGPFKVLSSTQQTALNISDAPISICEFYCNTAFHFLSVLPEDNGCSPPVIPGW